MRKYIITALLALVQTAQAQNYDDFAQAGKKHLENKEYAKAAEQFQRAVTAAENKNDKIYALTNLGYAQRMSGKRERAAESYAKALELDTASIALLTWRGNILLETDSAGEAIKCYDKIIARQPDNREILRLRAGAHTQAGNYKEGKQDYLKLISTDSNDAEARLGLALLYDKEGCLNECVMMLETLIENHPDNPEYYIVRSNVERKQKQFELALMDVEKAIELAPQNGNYHILRAELLKELGHDDAARRSNRKAIKLQTMPQEAAK